MTNESMTSERQQKIRDFIKNDPEKAKELKEALQGAQRASTDAIHTIAGRDGVFDAIRECGIDPDSDKFYRDNMGIPEGRKGFDKKYPPVANPAAKGPKSP